MMGNAITKYLAFLLPAFLTAEPVEVDLFIMSKCPYGVGAQQVVLDLQKLGLPGVRWEFHYICDYDGNDFSSLHGESEVAEDMRQKVILKHFGDRARRYLLSRTSHFGDDNWQIDAVFAGIPVDSIELLVEREGTQLLAADAELCESLNVSASPTLFINGRRLMGWKNDYPTLYMILARATGFSNDLSCFDDIDCFTPIDTLYGYCSARPNGGRCMYEYALEVNASLLVPDRSDRGLLGQVRQNLMQYFPNLKITVVDTSDSLFKRLNEEFGFNFLPLVLLGDEATKMYSFGKFKLKMHPQKLSDSYWVTTANVRPKYLLSTRQMPDTLVLCVMSYCPFGNNALMEYIDRFVGVDGNAPNPGAPALYVRYIVNYEGGEFVSLHGEEEVEEDKIQAVIQRYFPQAFLSYLRCRAFNVEGTIWQECAAAAGLDTAEVLRLVELKGDEILAQDAEFCRKNNIMASPTYIWQNKEVVSGFDEVVERRWR